MLARWGLIVVCLAVVPGMVIAQPQRSPGIRVEPFQQPAAESVPGWLPSAIRDALLHDLSRIRGIEPTDDPHARFVVRGSVQSANGMVRVDLRLTDGGRAVGGLRVTERADRLFELQDTVGEQTRQLVERSLRRRGEDVAPDPREVTIRYVGEVAVPEPLVRPSFLPSPPASLDAARLRRNHLYELPAGWQGRAWWYGRPGWYGWPGSSRWLW